MDHQNRAGGNVRKNFHIKMNPIKLTFDRIFEEDWEKEDAYSSSSKVCETRKSAAWYSFRSQAMYA